MPLGLNVCPPFILVSVFPATADPTKPVTKGSAPRKFPTIDVSPYF